MIWRARNDVGDRETNIIVADKNHDDSQSLGTEREQKESSSILRSTVEEDPLKIVKSVRWQGGLPIEEKTTVRWREGLPIEEKQSE